MVTREEELEAIVAELRRTMGITRDQLSRDVMSLENRIRELRRPSPRARSLAQAMLDRSLEFDDVDDAIDPRTLH
jgi:hypothetical protein